MPALARVALTLAVLLAVAAMLVAIWLWQTVQQMQRQVSTQVADMRLQTRETALLARQAHQQSQDAQSRSGALQSEVRDIQAQRAQIDAMLQGLARAKDENLLVDIDSAIELGQQQSQLTGSVDPLLAALVSSEHRLARSAQPRLRALHRAVQSDIDRLKGASLTDVPALAHRLDQLVAMVDTLPLRPGTSSASGVVARSAASAPPPDASVSWWRRLWTPAREALTRWMRARSGGAGTPAEAVFLPPDQGVYVREHFRLRLLNARMALLARQPDLLRDDLTDAGQMLRTYFDGASPLVQTARRDIHDIGSEVHAVGVPSISGTLDALHAARAAAATTSPSLLPSSSRVGAQRL